MSIDKFSKERFEQTLGNIFFGFESLGLEQNEEVYIIPVNLQARLKIRSSIDRTGYAADTGEDSIRIWVEVNQPNYRNPQEMIWQASGKKVDAYTTRVPGWEERLDSKIRILWDKAKQVRKPVKVCPDCGASPWVGFVKKDGNNSGRPFASHRDCNYFQWLDEEERYETSNRSENGQHSIFSSQVADMAHESVQSGKVAGRDARTSDSGTTDQRGVGDLEASTVQELSESAEQPGTSPRLDAEVESAKAALKAAKKPTRGKLYSDKTPNESQKEAIEASVDANVRVLAPPGSGKTFTIEYRYKYLVQEGVDPSNILVVTYSKKMADEMGERITMTCPQAELDQISTIHAFCYRMLTRWDEKSKFYGWQVPKDWQVKKIIDDLVEKVWQPLDDEETPGYKEVMLWIDNSKHHGLNEEEAKNYFIKNLGARFGNWVYQIRRQFDAQMMNQKFMTFADMLYHTEQQLKYDDNFRTKWQSQFSHVIVDEGQDTSYQAMRILITLGMEPGWNDFYPQN